MMELPPQRNKIDPGAVAWGYALSEATAKPDTSLSFCLPFKNPDGVVKYEPTVEYRISPASFVSRVFHNLGKK